jgi:hypothetical protein
MMNQRITMQKGIMLLTFSLSFYISRAQFFYNDVVALKASNNMYVILKKNNVHEVSATSVESDNTPTKGFVYSKIIANNASLIITHTELETGGISNEYDNYSDDHLVKSADSADNVLTTVEYTYDNDGKVLLVQTQSDDTAYNTHSTELHKWFYTGNIPDSMIRIKDKTDSTIIHFKKDENHNIAEEIWIKKGKVIEHYYYYYNEKAQLTDIVRFNDKVQQMLPDFLFEYNDDGIVATLTQIPQGSSDYVVWQYIYDTNGLKTRDVLFDKHQQILGSVFYTYK